MYVNNESAFWLGEGRRGQDPYELAPGSVERTALESRGRKLVLGVIACLAPVGDHEIARRCERYYGMGTTETRERLDELAAVGLAVRVGTGGWGLGASVQNPKSKIQN